MKKKFFLFSIIFLLSLLQNSFFSQLFGVGMNPNFILLVSFALVLTEDEDNGLYTALIGGLLQDLSGFEIIGTVTFVNVLMTAILIFAKKYLFKNFVFQIILLYFLNFFHFLIFVSGVDGKIKFALLSSLFNTVIFLGFYLIFGYFSSRETKSKYRI